METFRKITVTILWVMLVSLIVLIIWTWQTHSELKDNEEVTKCYDANYNETEDKGCIGMGLLISVPLFITFTSVFLIGGIVYLLIVI